MIEIVDGWLQTPWPERTTDAVRAGRSALLVGDIGAGKTQTARRAADALTADGLHVVRLHGDDAARGPLALFDALVTGARPADLASTVAGDRAESDTVLWIEDAHLLDDVTAAAVTDMVRYRSIRLIATSRVHPGLPAPLLMLVRDARADRLVIPPLTPDEARALVRDRCAPNIVAADALEEILNRAGGSPMHLVGLTTALLDSGGLAVRGGVCVWTGSAPAHSTLVDLIGPEIDGLSAAARSVLDVIAVTGPLPPDLLATVASAEALEEAVADGVVRTTRSGSRAIAMAAHPVYGEVALAMLSDAARTQTAASAWHALDGRFDTLDDEAAFVALEWARAAGTVAPLNLVHRVDRISQSMRGSHGRMLAATARIEHPDVSPADRVRALCLRADLLASAHDIPAALADCAAARAVLDGLTDDPERLPLVEVWALTAARCDLFATGDPSVIRTRLAAAEREAASDPDVLLRLKITGAGQNMYVGALPAATEALTEAYDRDPAALTPAILAGYGLVLTLVGREQEAIARLGAELQRALTPPAIDHERAGAVVGALIGGHLVSGRIPEAADHLGRTWASVDRELLPRDALAPLLLHDCLLAGAEGRWSDAVRSGRLAAAQYDALDETGMRRLAFAEVSLALAAHGEAAQSRQMHHEATRFAHSANGSLEPIAIEALARAALWRRDPSAAVEARAAADSCAASGAVLCELRSLHVQTLADADSLRTTIGRVRELAAIVDAPVAAAILRHCEARLAGDRDQAELASRELARCGIWMPLRALDGALSAREREIAAMAALGLSSKRIATMLFLSPRTVETHLTRAFAKLGVSSRDELADATGLTFPGR